MVRIEYADDSTPPVEKPFRLLAHHRTDDPSSPHHLVARLFAEVLAWYRSRPAEVSAAAATNVFTLKPTEVKQAPPKIQQLHSKRVPFVMLLSQPFPNLFRLPLQAPVAYPCARKCVDRA